MGMVEDNKGNFVPPSHPGMAREDRRWRRMREFGGRRITKVILFPWAKPYFTPSVPASTLDQDSVR